MSDERKEHMNQAIIDGLRAMADFLEEHPQPLYSGTRLSVFPDSVEEMRRLADGAGKLEKEVTDSYFFLKKKFGGDIEIAWIRDRNQVCERVVTGKKTVEKPIMQQVGTETVEVETFEWRCPPSLLALTERPSADPFLPNFPTKMPF